MLEPIANVIVLLVSVIVLYGTWRFWFWLHGLRRSAPRLRLLAIFDGVALVLLGSQGLMVLIASLAVAAQDATTPERVALQIVVRLALLLGLVWAYLQIRAIELPADGDGLSLSHGHEDDVVQVDDVRPPAGAPVDELDADRDRRAGDPHPPSAPMRSERGSEGGPGRGAGAISRMANRTARHAGKAVPRRDADQ